MNLKDIGCESMGWIHLTQDGVQWWDPVNIAVNLRVPQKTILA
jgi:hypothetical protein